MFSQFKKTIVWFALVCTMLAGFAFTAPTDLFIYFVGYVHDPDAAAVDDLARKYAISFMNSGASLVTGVSITMEADFTGFLLTGSTPAPDSIVTGTSVTWSGLSLADQATGTYTFVLTHPAEWAYVLTATIISETSSEIDSWDNTAVITWDVLPYPDSPTVFTGIASGDTAVLAWTAPGDYDLAAYMIRRSTVGYPMSISDGTVVSGAVVTTGFVDSWLADGIYYYGIFSRDASDNYSQLPLTGSVTIDTTWPLPVTDFTVTGSGDSAVLVWTNPVSDFDSVMIRRSGSAYPASTTDGILVAEDLVATSYVDSWLNNGTYYYALFAKDAYYNYSTPATGTVVINVTFVRGSGGGKASSVKKTASSSSRNDNDNDDDREDEDDDNSERDNDDEHEKEDKKRNSEENDNDLLDMLMDDLREGVDDTSPQNAGECKDPEYNEAYDFGFMYGLTTMSSCAEANMNGTLLRNHAAKMLSNYAMTVLGKDPDTTRPCMFTDMVEKDEEMKKYATLACQLGIMGLGADGKTPLQTFAPDNAVDKAQFATMLSRLLYGNAYNGNTTCRYCNHVAALQKEGIITITSDLKSPLKRAYALIMVMRASENE